MSLRFVFEPPPRIKLIRHQSITFVVGEPRIHFSKLKKPPPPKTESLYLPRERDRESSRKEREKDKSLERESRTNDSEKKTRIKSSSAETFDKSFSGCYELLQFIKNKKKLKTLFDLSNPEPNLRQIEYKLCNCNYDSIDEFFIELMDFFDGAYESYISDPEVQNSTKHFIAKIEQIQSKMINRRPTVSFSELTNQFQKFVDVPVSISKIESKTTENSKNSKRNLQQIAQELNKLDPKKKLKAKCLISIQMPSLPYYSSGIDLVLLPDSTIDSLVELINS